MSLQPKQFTQRPLPGIEGTTVVSGRGTPIEMGGPAKDRRTIQDALGEHVEFQTRRTLPNGGSQSAWQSQDSLARYGNRLAPPSGPSARETELDSGQRAMFMTPREIHRRYQPLDGDRYEADRWEDDEEFLPGETGSGERTLHENYLEQDEDLWARKLDETQMPYRDYKEDRGEEWTETNQFIERLYERDSMPQHRTGHTGTYEEQQDSYLGRKVDDWRESQSDTLYDSIAREGVKSPVRLGEEHGVLDKPMVVGGHHRLAAQGDINQDQFLPVLHHEDIHEAKTNKAYPYS